MHFVFPDETASTPLQSLCVVPSIGDEVLADGRLYRVSRVLHDLSPERRHATTVFLSRITRPEVMSDGQPNQT